MENSPKYGEGKPAKPVFPRYEFQMQYGSIGWAVGATLGYAEACSPQRVIACIGDGSFQVTCQDVSTMIRQELNPVIFLINNGKYTIESFVCKPASDESQVTCQDVSTMIRQDLNPVIFLINNGGYTIEVEIHDGPYNVIKNWDYCGLLNAIQNGEGKCWTKRVGTEMELVGAIKEAMGPKADCLCFIEVMCHKDDTSRELLEWGSRVSAANSRKPNPQ